MLVRGICFHNELSIRDPVSKNEHGGEYLLKGVESIMVGVVKIPGNIQGISFQIRQVKEIIISE